MMSTAKGLRGACYPYCPQTPYRVLRNYNSKNFQFLSVNDLPYTMLRDVWIFLLLPTFYSFLQSCMANTIIPVIQMRKIGLR